MTNQKIIRNETAFDRGVFGGRVNTRLVVEHIRKNRVNEFTTVDLANALIASGVSEDYARTERAVRQCVVCMVRNGMAVRMPGRKKKTDYQGRKRFVAIGLYGDPAPCGEQGGKRNLST